MKHHFSSPSTNSSSSTNSNPSTKIKASSNTNYTTETYPVICLCVNHPNPSQPTINLPYLALT